MYCIGTDIIEIARVEQSLSRWGDRFLKRVFTPAEISAYRHHPPSLAARFAAKEAAMKALGVGIGEIDWCDVEVLTQSGGQPCLELRGRARERADKMGLKSLAVSLSHSRDNAIAFVLGHRHDG
jgi:holo-[acyl-carrier protein] synthase